MHISKSITIAGKSQRPLIHFEENFMAQNIELTNKDMDFLA